MIEYKIYKSRWKAIWMMLLCSLFVVPGIWALNSSVAPEDSWIQWFAVIFFGLGYPVGIWQLLDRRPQIIVNEIGIYDRTVHADFINWEIIQDAYIRSIHGQKFICLVVDEKFEPSRKKGKIYKTTVAVLKNRGFQEMNLAVSFTNLNAKKLLEFILLMRNANPIDRKTVLVKALPQ